MGTISSLTQSASSTREEVKDLSFAFRYAYNCGKRKIAKPSLYLLGEFHLLTSGIYLLHLCIGSSCQFFPRNPFACCLEWWRHTALLKDNGFTDDMWKRLQQLLLLLLSLTPTKSFPTYDLLCSGSGKVSHQGSRSSGHLKSWSWAVGKKPLAQEDCKGGPGWKFLKCYTSAKKAECP